MPLNGFIVDFCCPDGKLVVELDGSQHANRTEADARRTENLEASGYLVMRFWNNDVIKNIDGVCETILNTLTQTIGPPHPNPLPYGEREPT